MSALESFLSGLEFLVAVEKDPVEHYLGPESSSCILLLLLVRASLSCWLPAHLTELTLIILFDLLRFQLTPGTGVHCSESELWRQDSQRRSLTQLPWVPAEHCGSCSEETLRKQSPK